MDAVIALLVLCFFSAMVEINSHGHQKTQPPASVSRPFCYNPDHMERSAPCHMTDQQGDA